MGSDATSIVFSAVGSAVIGTGAEGVASTSMTVDSAASASFEAASSVTSIASEATVPLVAGAAVEASVSSIGARVTDRGGANGSFLSKNGALREFSASEG